MKTLFECTECGAEGKVIHNMDPSYYQVTFCPFCGSDITLDDSEDEDDNGTWD